MHTIGNAVVEWIIRKKGVEKWISQTSGSSIVNSRDRLSPTITTIIINVSFEKIRMNVRQITRRQRRRLMNNVAGLFDPGGPATVARAKRMCNSLGRSPSFSKKECTPISQMFVKSGHKHIFSSDEKETSSFVTQITAVSSSSVRRSLGIMISLCKIRWVLEIIYSVGDILVK